MDVDQKLMQMYQRLVSDGSQGGFRQGGAVKAKPKKKAPVKKRQDRLLQAINMIAGSNSQPVKQARAKPKAVTKAVRAAGCESKGEGKGLIGGGPSGGRLISIRASDPATRIARGVTKGGLYYLRIVSPTPNSLRLVKAPNRPARGGGPTGGIVKRPKQPKQPKKPRKPRASKAAKGANQNPWIAFVKQWAAQNGMTYRDAIMDPRASATYKAMKQ
jgi:hypothetical protein